MAGHATDPADRPAPLALPSSEQQAKEIAKQIHELYATHKQEETTLHAQMSTLQQTAASNQAAAAKSNKGHPLSTAPMVSTTTSSSTEFASDTSAGQQMKALRGEIRELDLNTHSSYVSLTEQIAAAPPGQSKKALVAQRQSLVSSYKSQRAAYNASMWRLKDSYSASSSEESSSSSSSTEGESSEAVKAKSAEATAKAEVRREEPRCRRRRGHGLPSAVPGFCCAACELRNLTLAPFPPFSAVQRQP